MQEVHLFVHSTHTGIMPIPPFPELPPVLRLVTPEAKLLPLLLLLVALLLLTPVGPLPLLELPDAFLRPLPKPPRPLKLFRPPVLALLLLYSLLRDDALCVGAGGASPCSVALKS